MTQAIFAMSYVSTYLQLKRQTRSLVPFWQTKLREGKNLSF